MAPSAAQARPKLRIDARLAQRFNLDIFAPQTKLRYLPAAGRFDVDDYLSPNGVDAAYSLFLATRFSFDMTKQFKIVFDLDSGMLRPIARRVVRRAVDVTDAAAKTTQVRLYAPGFGTGATSNGRSLQVEVESTFFLRELYVRFAERDEFLFKMGRAHLVIGDGLIYDESALVLTMGGGDRDFWLEGTLGLPAPNMRNGIDSPLLHVRAVGYLSNSLRVGIHAAYIYDGGDLYADRLGQWYREGAVAGDPLSDDQADLRRQGWGHLMGSPRQSWGHLGFLGIDLGLNADRFIAVDLTAWVQAGEVGLDSPAPVGAAYGLAMPGPTKAGEDWTMLSLGFASQLKITVTPDAAWAVELWGLMVSGDSNPLSNDGGSDTVFGFQGIRPRLRHTNLFFSGGLNETLSYGAHESFGLGEDGFMGGGLNVSWEDEDSGLYIESSVSALAAFVGNQTAAGGGFYGVEFNIEALYPINSWLTVSAEYDILFGGDAWRSSDPIHLLRIGLDITYSSDALDLR